MKLYIEAISTYRSDKEEIEVKKELKQKYKLDTRRQDTFIHLAVLGAQRLKEVVEIQKDNELYITTGIGNVEVLQRTYDYVHIQKQFIRPFDFINMLGNTTSYYVASSLGVKGKNIFQVSDNFTFIHSLISIYASLSTSNKSAILGSVDLTSEPEIVVRNLLGISKESSIVSSSNYQKLSLNKENSIAEISFTTQTYSYEEIKELIKNDEKIFIISSRCVKLKDINNNIYCETILSDLINEQISKKVDFTYIDYYDNKFKILNLINNIIR